MQLSGIEAKREFRGSDTHGVLQRFGADIRATSEGHGWSSRRSKGRIPSRAGSKRSLTTSLCCTVAALCRRPLHPAGRSLHAAFQKEASFLPAGHACEVGLHGALDTLHIYLRANLVPVHDVTPLLVERDVVIQHLAQAVDQAVCENVSNSDLFIDPIARALANRVSAISRSSEPRQVQTAGCRTTNFGAFRIS
jgi:AraC family transcriptional regulator